ncbi:DOPA-like domain-containing protein [Calycina marina]|uniref:DOPA-like domain-containing protein n=1 Tax=Calycina marina TaxID=1763456 RepID=A0A9P7ZAA6_9HELO|nr:DOPA-like domain-containing protein [Calycina marina]
MADLSLYSHPSPLVGYEDDPPSPTEKLPIGIPTHLIDPLDKGVRGACFKKAVQANFARKLWERIHREFLEPQPTGPQLVAMFEVNLFTPAQLEAFIPWLVINRGSLSVLVQPNTVDEETGEQENEGRDDRQRATWVGERVVLDLSLFKDMKALKEAFGMAYWNCKYEHHICPS